MGLGNNLVCDPSVKTCTNSFTSTFSCTHSLTLTHSLTHSLTHRRSSPDLQRKILFLMSPTKCWSLKQKATAPLVRHKHMMGGSYGCAHLFALSPFSSFRPSFRPSFRLPPLFTLSPFSSFRPTFHLFHPFTVAVHIRIISASSGPPRQNDISVRCRHMRP